MKRSPKRSSECWMRSTWTMSTPMPSTLMGKVSVHLAHSPVIILHSREHFTHGIFPAYKNCARNNGVPDVELGQMRNPVNERDVSIIDAMAGSLAHSAAKSFGDRKEVSPQAPSRIRVRR